MRLRRALATVAATAAIAPVALLVAPAAFASGETPSPAAASESAPGGTETNPSPGESSGQTEPPAPTGSSEQTESAPAPTGSESTEPGKPTSDPSASESAGAPGPTASESTTAPASPSPSASSTEDPETPLPEPSLCDDSKVDVDITGLPGKIAAGSGWHKFSLTVANNSGSTLDDLEYLAGVSPDADGEELFQNKQVGLQAWNPEDKVWDDLDEFGYAFGYAGVTEELPPDYLVDIPMRINVKAGAPVGAGFTLGATIYGDADGECTGFGEVAYKFQIVAAGTDTEGTKPQTGGKAPVATERPSADTPAVTGSLAETGSSSALPAIGLVGGLAVVVGGGAVFVVRRRKADAGA